MSWSTSRLPANAGVWITSLTMVGPKDRPPAPTSVILGPSLFLAMFVTSQQSAQ